MPLGRKAATSPGRMLPPTRNPCTPTQRATCLSMQCPVTSCFILPCCVMPCHAFGEMPHARTATLPKSSTRTINRATPCRTSCPPPPHPQTRQLVRSPFIPLLLGIPYAIILWQAWQQGTLQALAAAVQSSSPFPDPAALANVFTQPTLTAMAWLHLLLLDLLQAR